MKAFVIGATGFIGGAIARAAVERGWEVRALRRRPSAVGALDDIAGQIEWIQGNIEETGRLAEALAGSDMVFHAAGYYTTRHAPLDSHIKNATLQINQVLNAFEQSGAGRLIFTSSLTTIGRSSDPGRMSDERDPYPVGSEPASPYYECKAAMEAAVMAAAARGLNCIACNPTMTFGPGDVKAFTGRLIIIAHQGLLAFSLPGELNFTDVRDVAAGHLAAGEKLRAGERIILGGHNFPVPEACRIVNAVAGRKPPLFTVPRQVVETIGRVMNLLPIFAFQDHMTTIHCWQPLNTSKMEQELGIRPRPFEDTVRDARTWYLEHNYIK